MAKKKKEENLQTPKSKTRVVEDNQTRHAHRIPIAFCTDYYFHWALLYVNTLFFQVLMHEYGALLHCEMKICAWALK